MNRWILVLALTGLAGCQTSPFAGSAAFQEHDADDDGVISAREAQDSMVLAKHFKRLDTNASGGIDRKEYSVASVYVADLDFSRVDVNEDGVISRREARSMPASLREVFSRVDTDEDDNVSPTEYTAARMNLLEGLEFERLDRDGDGVIGREEAKKVPELHTVFARVDSDGDGLISKKEFAAAQR